MDQRKTKKNSRWIDEGLWNINAEEERKNCCLVQYAKEKYFPVKKSIEQIPLPQTDFFTF